MVCQVLMDGDHKEATGFATSIALRARPEVKARAVVLCLRHGIHPPSAQFVDPPAAERIGELQQCSDVT